MVRNVSRWAYSPINWVFRPVRGLFWKKRCKKKRESALGTVVDEETFEKIKVVILKRWTFKGACYSVRIGRVYKNGPLGMALLFYPSDAHSYAQAFWWAVEWFIKFGELSQRQYVFMQCLDEGLAGLDTVLIEFRERCKQNDKHNMPSV